MCAITNDFQANDDDDVDDDEFRLLDTCLLVNLTQCNRLHVIERLRVVFERKYQSDSILTH